MADEFLKEYDEAAKGFAKLEVRPHLRQVQVLTHYRQATQSLSRSTQRRTSWSRMCVVCIFLV